MLTNSQILDVYKTAEKAIRATARKFGTLVTDDTLADLQQGTLIKVIKSYDADRGVPNAMAWRVAANEATDYLRGRSVGAIRERGESLTVEDSEGGESISDVSDDSSNPFDLIAARQLDAELTRQISNLTDSQKAGVRGFYASDDETMDGSTRISKMRAVDALSEGLKASHFAIVAGEKKAKRAKAPKRAPKVAADEVTETPALAKLRTLSRVEYELAHCQKATLIVLG